MRGCLGALMLLVACSEAPAAGGARGAGGSSSASSGGPMVCVPGIQIACACPGGTPGAQACLADGHGYGPCDCPTSTSAAASSSTASSSTTTAAASSSAASSSSDAASSSSTGVLTNQCVKDTQCHLPPDTYCHVAACVNDMCTVALMAQGTSCTQGPAGGLCDAGTCAPFIPVICTVAGIDYQLCDGVDRPGSNDEIGIYADADPTVLTATCDWDGAGKHYCAPGTRCFVTWSNYPVGYGTCK